MIRVGIVPLLSWGRPEDWGTGTQGGTKQRQNSSQGHWIYIRDICDLIIHTIYSANNLKTSKGALRSSKKHRQGELRSVVYCT